jgi:hypothetical protein
MKWDFLEQLPGLVGTAETWGKLIDAEESFGGAGLHRAGIPFAVFQSAFLHRYGREARFVPCPRGCGCAHEVLRNHDHTLVGVCRCENWNCDDLPLTSDQVVLWQLHWGKFGRAVRQALGLRGNLEETGLPNTVQIGGWSVEMAPVILTIQHQSERFTNIAATLAGRLGGRFLLLAPTARHVTPGTREHLAGVEADFLSLEMAVRLTPNGTVQPVRPPGELFVRFNPQSRESLDEDVARQAFALLEQLDASEGGESPSVLTVFRLYCGKEMPAEQVARKCGCSKTTVLRRLQQIAAKTGVSAAELRRLSPHLLNLKADNADSRAGRIRERSLIYDDRDAV